MSQRCSLAAAFKKVSESWIKKVRERQCIASASKTECQSSGKLPLSHLPELDYIRIIGDSFFHMKMGYF